MLLSPTVGRHNFPLFDRIGTTHSFFPVCCPRTYRIPLPHTSAAAAFYQRRLIMFDAASSLLTTTCR